MFGAGTACVVLPVSTICYEDKMLEIPTMKQDDKQFEVFLNSLTRIQYGYVKHPWGRCIDDVLDDET
jgi:hypothetical protein